MTDPATPPLQETSIVAIDHGRKRIGVAVKPAGQRMALPLRVVDGADPARAMEELRGIIAERGAGIVVVGLPLNADPAQAREVKRFTRKLREGVAGVRWRFVDETLTSHAAEELRRDSGLGPLREGDDAAAAALILEAYLQKPG